MKTINVYLICQNDKYSLPLKICYSQREVAQWIGCTTRNVEIALQAKKIAFCGGYLIERTEITE